MVNEEEDADTDTVSTNREERVAAVEVSLKLSSLDDKIRAEKLLRGDNESEYGPLCDPARGGVATCPTYCSIFCCNAHFFGAEYSSRGAH